MKILYKLLFLIFSVLSVSTIYAQYEKNLSVYLTTGTKLIPKTTHDLNFVLRLTNSDLEYGDSLALEFPAGVIPVSVSNDVIFAPTTEGQDPENFNGVSGQIVSWGDNNNKSAIGGIETGKTINFTVKVSVDENVFSPLWLSFFVSGDEMKFSPEGNPKDYKDSLQLQIQEPIPDLALDFKRPIGEMYLYPSHQLTPIELSSWVVNNGGVLEDFGALIYLDVENNFQVSRQLPNPMQRNDTVYLEAGVEYKPKIGINKLSVFLDNEIDQNLADNFDSLEFGVTDTVLSRTSDSSESSLSLVGTGSLGTWLEITKKDTLTSISVHLNNSLNGDSLRVKIYSFNGIPDTAVAISRTFINNSTVPVTDWFQLDFEETVIIDSGKFFVAIEQLMISKLEISTSSINFFPNRNYVNQTGQSTWQDASVIGPEHENNYLIKANFGTPSKGGSVGILEVGRTAGDIWPNPVQNFLFIRGMEGAYTILELSGKKILEGILINNIIDVSSLTQGLYIFKMESFHSKFVKY